MKTIYNKDIFHKLLKFTTLVFFLMVFSCNVKAQYASPQVICYGDPIYLFCGGLPGCGDAGATYTWADEFGSWMSNDLNPIILPGSPAYHSGHFYLSVQYLPDGLSSGVASAILLNQFTVTGTVTPISCNGGNNGSIIIIPNGGEPGYGPYAWSNGATTMNLYGLTEGNYNVTVTDANLCTATGNFSVTQPAGITITKTGGSNVICNGTSTGYIAISVSGGTGTYSYLWNNGGTSSTISNLYAGSYTVTVTDLNSCTKSQSWTVTQPIGMSILISGTSPNCYGGSNGTINTTLSGGVTPYIYTWSNGGAGTPDRTGLSAGIYSVTVSDFNMCSKSASYQVIQPSEITLTGTASNVTCQGNNTGMITTTVSGGSGGATSYIWNNGQTGATAINLTAGTYTVTITNGGGCTRSRSFEVTALTFTSVAITPTTCASNNNGSIQLIVSGGVTPYLYNWNNGQTSNTAVNLTAGVYTVTVIDASTCAKVGTWQVTSPSSMSFNPITTNLLCNGSVDGRIDLTVSGGTPGYAYKWNVLGYQGQGTPHISSLYAGTYTVTVTDNNSCSKIQNWAITQPAALSSKGVVTNITCYGGHDGAVSVSGMGGTPQYSYKWSTGSTSQMITGLAVGIYYVTITDANSCHNLTWLNITQPSDITIAGIPVNISCKGSNTGMITTTVSGGSGGNTIYLWNNGQAGSTASNLSAGTYTVTVTNAAGCNKTTSFQVLENAAKVITLVTKINPSCYASGNGLIQVSVSGGLGGPYQYIWNNGQTNAIASNLTTGTYTVTVTDAGTCPVTGSWTIIAPSALSITGIPTNVFCNGQSTGKIDITVSGGTPNYVYNWNVLGSQGQGTAHVSGLFAGTYTVTVTDNNSCYKIQSWQLTQPSALSGNGITSNVTCYGESNGNATISGFGGTPPYSYKWITGSTSQLITGLSVGRYNVTITDASSCVNFTWQDITQPTNISVMGTAFNVTCQGGGTGKITTTVSGGSGGTANYLWSNGQTGSTAINLPVGTYTVTVTNTSGCTKTNSFTVSENVAKIITLVAKYNPLCYASSDGSIQISVSGGLGAPYQYIWNNGQITSTATGLSAGTFSVTVTDSGSCPVSGSWNLVQPNPLSITGITTNVLCNGMSSGKIDITIGGGTPNYSYYWNVLSSQGQGTAHVSSLFAGTYTVTIADNNLCTKIQSWVITQPSALSAFGNTTNVTCFGGNNGSATITAFGGTIPYSFKWSNGSTAQMNTGLSAGRYFVTITDAYSCQNFTWLDITQPADISIAGTPVNVICQGYSNGMISTTVTGGSGGTTTYLWSNGQTGSFASNLAAGTYTVTVTNAAGCAKFRSFMVTEDPTITFSSVSIINPKCYNGNDGSIQLIVGGGVSPYVFFWSNGQTTGTAINLAAGSYSVTVTDAHGCTKVGNWQVTQPAALSGNGAVSNVTCFGGNNGTASISGTGGTSPYSYKWNNGPTGQFISGLSAGRYYVTVTDANTCQYYSWQDITQPTEITITGTVVKVMCQGGNNGQISTTVSGGSGGTTNYLWSNGQTGSTAINLSAGIYTVTVTNASGCVKSKSFAVTENTSIIFGAVVVIPVKCYGGNNGSIQLLVSGGVSPYSYLWNNGQTTSTAINLVAGIYTVTVSDAVACAKVGSWLVTQPVVLTGNGGVTNVTCYGGNNGTAVITGFGGTSPYQYKWSTGSIAQLVTGLTAGRYYVTITDANSCQNFTWQDISQPFDITIAGTPVKVSCQGSNTGQITTTISGGSGGTTTYLWNNGQTGSTAINLSPGTYTVTVTNAAGCIKVTNFTVTENPAITFGPVVVVPSTCFNSNNGSIQLFVSGGVSPYSYLWNNGLTTGLISNLAAGVYTVAVTDAVLCTKAGSWQVTQPTALSANGVVTNVSCYGGANGTATITGLGGTAPYTYKWSTGSTAQLITGLTVGRYYITVTDAHNCVNYTWQDIVQPTDITISGTPFTVFCQGSSTGQITTTITGGSGGTTTYLWNNGQTGSTTTNLSAGIYTLTVTNAAGCTKSKSFTVAENPAITFGSVVVIPSTCYNGNNGAIQLFVSGGVSPYSYLWNNGLTTATISNLAAGSYSVTVTDAVLCTKTGSWQVTQPSALSGNGVVTNVTCYGGANGTATISGFGGTAPYTYKWVTGSTAQLITGLTVGRYYVTITDAHNCVNYTWQDIVQPSDITISGTPVKVSCQGSSTGQITTTISGGSGGTTTYLWSNGQTGSTAINLSAGTYTVTVTNAAGCIKFASFTVTENPAITFGSVVVISSTCYNSNNGSIQLFVSGGVSPYAYLWSNGQTTGTISNLVAGAYSVTVTDILLCTRVGSWMVTAPSAMSISSIVTNIACNGQSSGKIDITVSGGTAPYTYNWNVTGLQGQGTAHVSALAAGSYTVTVSDNKLCTKTQSWVISQPGALSSNGSVTNVSCYGGNNGSAAISGSGGTIPYAYKWITGSTLQLITGLTAGRYDVTITDANSCANYTWQTITQPSNITITNTVVNVTCQGSNNGQIITTVNGGSGGLLTYLWSNGQTGSTATSLTAGSYTVTVTNGAGCSAVSLPISVGTTGLLPGPAGAITGPAVVNQGQSGVAYSVVPIANATGYIWTLPSGASIASGPNTSSITVDFSTSASSGIINVKGTNACGNGLPSDDKNITVIPISLTLLNISLGAGTYCYNAIQTIYVAGGSSTFTVNSGAIVTMIAGQNIKYMQGTSVKSGGYMHGYITTSGLYCTTPVNPVVNTPSQVNEVQTSVSEIVNNQKVRIYPNPTNGSFTIELIGMEEPGITKVQIFGMNGIGVKSENLSNERKHILSVENLRPGIYFVHVTNGSINETMKLIKL